MRIMYHEENAEPAVSEATDIVINPDTADADSIIVTLAGTGDRLYFEVQPNNLCDEILQNALTTGFVNLTNWRCERNRPPLDSYNE